MLKIKFSSKETNHNSWIHQSKMKLNQNLTIKNYIFKKKNLSLIQNKTISKKSLNKVKKIKKTKNKSKNKKVWRIFFKGKFILKIKMRPKMISKPLMDFSIFKMKIRGILFCLKKPTISISTWPAISLSITQKMTRKRSEICLITPELSRLWKNNLIVRANPNVFSVPRADPQPICLSLPTKIKEFTVPCQEEIKIWMWQKSTNLIASISMELIFMISVAQMETRRTHKLFLLVLQCMTRERLLTSCTESRLKSTKISIKITFCSLR